MMNLVKNNHKQTFKHLNNKFLIDQKIIVVKMN